jgi:hypothetical protein
MAERSSNLAAIRRSVERALDRRPAESPKRGRRGSTDRTALVETPGFELAIAAIMKDESVYIEEWLCHHLAVGVQHFFLYDNGSTDGIEHLLEGYLNRGIVTFVRFPMRGLQRDAYNHALRFFGGSAEWLAYIDIDEFLVPAADGSVREVLRHFPDASQVLVSRKEFCYSGHRTRPEALVTEAYTLASRDVPRVGRADILAKAIVRPRRIWRMGVHSADTVDGATVNTAGEASPEGRPAIANPTFEALQINHYYTKSWEEFSVKLARANTSTHAFRLPEVPFDIPGEPDHAVDRWVPRTKALIDEMRTLSPRPYRYGSHLALPDFPRSDQFRVQAASLITNEMAGLDRPRKQREFDPLPMPGIRGAVARAEDHGYVAAPGRLLGSIHTEHQVRWLEGEIVWSLVGSTAPPAIEGGSLAREDGASGWHGTVVADDASITIDASGRPLRQHAVLIAIGTPAATQVRLLTRNGDGAWEEAVTVALPRDGTYLGFIALDDRPRTVDDVRLTVSGVASFELLDLALVSYG